MDVRDAAYSNFDAFVENPYPGRGIILGKSPDCRSLIQVYWIMGRSEGSRNRVFIEENGFLKTKLWDESKATDPTLLIYYPMRHLDGVHIVSNGDQTDTIYQALQSGGTFESALDTRTFEPDPPIYTPRITGMTTVGTPDRYKLSILKPMSGDADSCVRCYYNYEAPVNGVGNCIQTYTLNAEGQPAPFQGDPYILPLFDDIDRTLQAYWNALDPDNKVSLVIKFIDASTGEFELRIANKHAG